MANYNINESDLETDVYMMLSAKDDGSKSLGHADLLKSYKLFLEKFDQIINKSILDLEKFDRNIFASSRNMEFTELYDEKFYMKFGDLIDSKILLPQFIPVDDNHHLALWFWKLNQNPNSTKGMVYYSRIDVGQLFPKTLPLIDIRINHIFEEDELPEKIIFKGKIYNSFNAFYNLSDPEVLMKAYSKMEYLVNNSK